MTEMNDRQRFLETMRFGKPDRVPYFEEGIREGVLEEWWKQGLEPGKRLEERFCYDRREEIALDLDPGLNLVKLAESRFGIDKLRHSLNPQDDRRLPRDWKRRAKRWREREHVLMIEVHEGFFISLGIGEWRSFAEAIYLVMDQPAFVHKAMEIYGECSAGLTERFLKEVSIDAAVFSEPIGGNHGSLISPQMYQEFVLASYRPIIEVLSNHGVETIIFRTYANARALLPVVFSVGFNCLWAVERNPQAMDYLDIRQSLGNDIRLIGGIDVDILHVSEDAIRGELERVLPPLLEMGGYIPLADGRVREGVPFLNYAYYRRMLEKLSQ